MKKILLASIVVASSLFATQFTINLDGQYAKEKKTIKLDLLTDDEGKIVAGQKIDFLDPSSQIKSLKIVTASGLKGTMVDERELVVFYKTSLTIQGLKIRNLYKVAHARVYNDNTNIVIKFDKDHYQNIVSFLRYHNVDSDTIKDLDNLYGSWQDIEVSNKHKSTEVKKTGTSEISELN
ncbi:MAG: hypothetical protein ISR68_02600 [Campylobacterales bacterium]|nr:hypothetical protein [Campylobacterales bacterium]